MPKFKVGSQDLLQSELKFYPQNNFQIESLRTNVSTVNIAPRFPIDISYDPRMENDVKQFNMAKGIIPIQNNIFESETSLESKIMIHSQVNNKINTNIVNVINGLKQKKVLKSRNKRDLNSSIIEASSSSLALSNKRYLSDANRRAKINKKQAKSIRKQHFYSNESRLFSRSSSKSLTIASFSTDRSRPQNLHLLDKNITKFKNTRTYQNTTKKSSVYAAESNYEFENIVITQQSKITLSKYNLMTKNHVKYPSVLYSQTDISDVSRVNLDGYRIDYTREEKREVQLDKVGAIDRELIPTTNFNDVKGDEGLNSDDDKWKTGGRYATTGLMRKLPMAFSHTRATSLERIEHGYLPLPLPQDNDIVMEEVDNFPRMNSPTHDRNRQYSDQTLQDSDQRLQASYQRLQEFDQRLQEYDQKFIGYDQITPTHDRIIPIYDQITPRYEEDTAQGVRGSPSYRDARDIETRVPAPALFPHGDDYDTVAESREMVRNLPSLREDIYPTPDYREGTGTRGDRVYDGGLRNDTDYRVTQRIRETSKVYDEELAEINDAELRGRNREARDREVTEDVYTDGYDTDYSDILRMELPPPEAEMANRDGGNYDENEFTTERAYTELAGMQEMLEMSSRRSTVLLSRPYSYYTHLTYDESYNSDFDEPLPDENYGYPNTRYDDDIGANERDRFQGRLDDVPDYNEPEYYETVSRMDEFVDIPEYPPESIGSINQNMDIGDELKHSSDVEEKELLTEMKVNNKCIGKLPLVLSNELLDVNPLPTRYRNESQISLHTYDGGSVGSIPEIINDDELLELEDMEKHGAIDEGRSTEYKSNENSTNLKVDDLNKDKDISKNKNSFVDDNICDSKTNIIYSDGNSLNSKILPGGDELLPVLHGLIAKVADNISKVNEANPQITSSNNNDSKNEIPKSDNTCKYQNEILKSDDDTSFNSTISDLNSDTIYRSIIGENKIELPKISDKKRKKTRKNAIVSAVSTQPERVNSMPISHTAQYNANKPFSSMMQTDLKIFSADFKQKDKRMDSKVFGDVCTQIKVETIENNTIKKRSFQNVQSNLPNSNNYYGDMSLYNNYNRIFNSMPREIIINNVQGICLNNNVNKDKLAIEEKGSYSKMNRKFNMKNKIIDITKKIIKPKLKTNKIEIESQSSMKIDKNNKTNTNNIKNNITKKRKPSLLKRVSSRSLAERRKLINNNIILKKSKVLEAKFSVSYSSCFSSFPDKDKSNEKEINKPPKNTHRMEELQTEKHKFESGKIRKYQKILKINRHADEPECKAIHSEQSTQVRAIKFTPSTTTDDVSADNLVDNEDSNNFRLHKMYRMAYEKSQAEKIKRQSFAKHEINYYKNVITKLMRNRKSNGNKPTPNKVIYIL